MTQDKRDATPEEIARDRIWCDALTRTLGADDILRVTGMFNKIRPDATWGSLVYRPTPEDTGGEELKPCPFCGGEAHRFTCEEESNFGGDVIGCKECEASTRVFFGEQSGLVEAWNVRADGTLAAERDRLREALEEFRKASQEYYNCSESTVGIKRRFGEAMDKANSALKGE